MKPKILIVDDDTTLLDSIGRLLEEEGYDIIKESNPVYLSENFESFHFDLMLADIKMPGINGIDLMKIISKKRINIPVVFISGQSTIKTAVEAIKFGAYDFLEKPVDPDRLFLTIRNALLNNALLHENKNIYNELKENNKFIGESISLKKLLSNVNQVAPTNAKVLIQGESGTGKELIAWAIHHNSLRKGMPYIKLNCAAIPSELLESELFGHTKGSFTGADKDKIGKFAAADGGTLFLDEIGDMSFMLQSKLLRAIEENEIEVIGENVPREIDVRIIAATNRNLEEMVNKGEFREDLYHRLNVVSLCIPPLRKRKEDILPLTYHFLRNYNSVYNKKITTISRQAEGLLLNHDYPGNVRELRNIIEKAVIYSLSNQINLEILYKAIGNVDSSYFNNEGNELDLKEARKTFERNYILEKLHKNNWKLGETASSLGIDRTHLFRKMQDLGIEKE